MKLRVLGSCSGGLPPWNSGAPNAVRARAGDPRFAPRSQTSVAVSADGERWSLLDASPDLRHQLAAFPALHPRPGTRDVPLDSVVLTSADLDRVLGLLLLRDALSFRIVSTDWVRRALLDHDAAWRPLEPAWGATQLDLPVRLDRAGELEARLFPVSSTLPPHLREVAKPHPQTTVGVRITQRSTGARLAFVPAMASLGSATLAELAAADCRLVDGTFFSADEPAALQPGAPQAAALGHLPVTGVEASLAALAGLPGRTFYIGMGAANPVLDEASPERDRVRRAGVELACDGLELEI